MGSIDPPDLVLLRSMIKMATIKSTLVTEWLLSRVSLAEDRTEILRR